MNSPDNESLNNPIERLLLNGLAPLSSGDVFRQLDADDIPYETLHHKPLWTVEDAKSVRPAGDSGHTKNLFLKGRKKDLWLFSLHEDRQVDLRGLAETVGAKRFSFASPQRLMHYLGVIPGAVSPFALLNDAENAVNFYIDSTLVQSPHLHIHPLDNTMTTSLATQALLDFLNRRGHSHTVLD